MAHIEVWHRCPVCNTVYRNQQEAIECRKAHPIIAERWAVGKGGKAVRIFDNCSINGCGGVSWALREADLSDDIEERRQQLAEEERE